MVLVFVAKLIFDNGLMRAKTLNIMDDSIKRSIKYSFLFSVACLFLGVSLLSACWDKDAKQTEPKTQTATTESTYPIVGESISWQQLPGWEQDRLQEAWPALLQNCKAMAHRNLDWGMLCAMAQQMPESPRASEARAFFERYFRPHSLSSPNGERQGLLTGYYEPLLHGSYQADERYRYPLYRPPPDMLTIELASLYPELEGKRVRGRLVEGNKVVPYYDRAAIDGVNNPLAGQEILWVDNRVELFFLQIQGSGRVELADGSMIGVGYANQNGHPYIALGRRLVELGKMQPGTVNMFSIKTWLADHPDEAVAMLNENPSYVFFNLRENAEAGPLGSLGVPLTAERSIAVDRKMIELGSVLFLDTNYPDDTQPPLQKLVFAQDTGGAIKGTLRGDFFFGSGAVAEQRAGLMARKGNWYLLRLKPF